MQNNQRLTVDMPLELHRDFKIWCVLNGKKMNDVVRDLVREKVSAKASNLSLECNVGNITENIKRFANH